MIRNNAQVFCIESVFLVFVEFRVFGAARAACKGVCLAWRPADQNPIYSAAEGIVDVLVDLVVREVFAAQLCMDCFGECFVGEANLVALREPLVSTGKKALELLVAFVR
jgi:hypothetical protein